MFKKILIANRGEIACRVIRSAKEMGIATVAVYSDADAQALHVQMADEAVHIGPPAAAQSYLVIEKILDAVKQTGAEAVHPGYGFLSENSSFANALAESGVAFIGPPVKAIEVMGDKIQSKLFAQKAGVNVIPGHTAEVADANEAVRISGEIGYPVMIKASAGGGGKGMRIAFSEAEVAQGFESSRSEARASFGDDRIFIEKYIEQPRHIEIQVLADTHGHVIHLNERECSIQRRNQKVVEEAPSSFVDGQMRATMGAQAVALARAVDYTSAGTVEFIVDKDHNFYFLEMNTRLQVEHPVTELITGVDLVEQMIRVAAGEELQLAQEDIGITGWAIESRLYAEDPYRGFLPSTGRLVYYRPPEEGIAKGVTIRNDTGVYEGGEIPVHYDPMIAKLCVHAPDRLCATEAMGYALDSFVIEGIGHNIPFLGALMRHERWRRGDISTNFIAEEYADGFHNAEPDADEAVRLAIVAAHMNRVLSDRRGHISGQMRARDFAFADRRVVVIGDQAIKVEMEFIAPDQWSVSCDGGKTPYMLKSGWRPGDLLWNGRIDGEKIAVQFQKLPGGFVLGHGGLRIKAFVYSDFEAQMARLMPVKLQADMSKYLLCPMPGLVVSIAVEEGQEVKAGQTLSVIEAMKMENVLKAERDGVVAKVNAHPGDNLSVDEVILEFE